MPDHEERLGLVVGGSLVEGLRIRLDEAASVEDIRVGHFLRVAGEKHDFFCLVKDVRLDATSDDVAADPPSPDEGFLRAVLLGTSAYGTLEAQPMLMLSRENAGAEGEEAGPLPVKTVPSHFSPVFSADESDFTRVFGEEAADRFLIGAPQDMDAPVRLDLRRFVERSNGVFGKSGTGKSFLTRLLLCGVIKSNVATNLVFDMHSEYGWSSQSESGSMVKGLRQLFSSNQVATYTLDWDSARDRPVKPDGQIRIGLNEIDIEDIALLQNELRLNPTAVESASLCEDRFKDRWIAELTDDDTNVKELADDIGANSASLGALRNKLRAHITRLKFIQTHVSMKDSGLELLIADLERGRHVVLEFGQHRTLIAYMLAANVITRRIYQRWTTRVEEHKQSGGKRPAPTQLMITIEEAHRFLNPGVSEQTIFGTIARELRKYNVTLLVVDQRPSGIDDEVLSQIGTRITCALNDDKDIEAVLAGVSGASQLRSILARLDTRQEAMIMGHAVPMPMPIRTRSYDEAFYATLGPWGDDPVFVAEKSREYDELFPPDES
ncbi:MAG: ATP-binding protein [Chloroflexota bacterium]